MEKSHHPEAKRLDTCATCAYLDVMGKDYCCRRYPPTVTTLLLPEVNPMTKQQGLSMRNQAALPAVNLTEWCGEFKAKADA